MTVKSSIESNVTKFEDQLVLMGAKLDELVASLKVAGQETKIDVRKRLDQAKTKLEATKSKLEEARAAGEDRWDHFKDGVESSWKELEGAFHELTH